LSNREAGPAFRGGPWNGQACFNPDPARNMIVLDCESTNSIYSSLEAISGAKREAIESFLKTIDLESLYNSSSPPQYPSNDFLLNAFARTLRSDLSYDATCWFHLTRTDETITFEEGILPLGPNLESILNWLYRLFKGEIPEHQWSAFRTELPRRGSYIYQAKTEKQFYWGPYAILIRDLAFKPQEVGNHDYLSGSEIIEDICYCFQEIFNVDLLALFRKKTKPCIVKFVDYHHNAKYVRAALWHLHKIAWQEKCTDYCNDCFDGRGAPIPKDQILKIEFPPYGN
jgi:hypothetical protein